jgi:Domain of Unknown Function with PDB structure (DUF3857)/Transglutaminase-like superfamily
MRIRLLIRLLLIVSCLGSGYVLRAQFQEPTKEELQMTSDPKAPGAAAVYLYREEKVDDEKHFHTTYARLKILTEKGKELATVHVPYERGNFKVTDIKGRTIHADGTVVPLTAKPSDLMDVKTKNLQINTMVFTLPAVEVGSILEYRLDLRYDDGMVSSPDWEVQQPYFVHKAHYFFNPSKSGAYITDEHGDPAPHLMYSTTGPQDRQKVVPDPQGHFSMDVTDVPAIPDEDSMPPLNSVNWRVKFYYTPYRTGAEFWKSEGKRWVKDSERFANSTGALKEAAGQIVAAGDTDEQKAHKLYDAVQKLENTDFTREKTEAERKKEKIKQIKDAEGVWKEKTGSSDQLALLYVALARAAGLQAYPMQVVNRNRAIFDGSLMSMYQFDDYIAIVKVGDKEIFVDPGQKDCPFGLLHWKHTLAGGMRDSAQGPGYGMTEPLTYLQTQIQRAGTLDIGADGSVKGTVRFIMTGEEALRWRQLNLENDEEEVKKQFNESLREVVPDGVQAELDQFQALGDYNAQLMAVVKLSGSLGTATGKRFFLPGVFFESHGKHPFVAQDKRTIPVDVKYPVLYKDDVTYRLPDGMTVESSPQASDITWPQHAQLKTLSTAVAGGVMVTRLLAYNFTVVDPKNYAELHDFYGKVAAADQQQVVLTKTAAKSGGQ